MPDLGLIKGLLKKLELEKINTKPSNREINAARQYTMSMTAFLKVMAPGLTSTVATTLLGLGLCQELSQRFVLEYVLRTRKQDIALIFLINANDKKSNHALVYIGDLQVPDTYYVGRGDDASIIKTQNHNMMSVTEFLEKHIGLGIFVDPLLNLVVDSVASAQAILEYCKENQIDKLAGVKDYSATQRFAENADGVMDQAQEVASNVARSTPVFSIKENKTHLKIAYPTQAEEEVDRIAFLLKDRSLFEKTENVVSLKIDWLRQVYQYNSKNLDKLAQDLQIDSQYLTKRIKNK